MNAKKKVALGQAWESCKNELKWGARHLFSLGNVKSPPLVERLKTVLRQTTNYKYFLRELAAYMPYSKSVRLMFAGAAWIGLYFTLRYFLVGGPAQVVTSPTGFRWTDSGTSDGELVIGFATVTVLAVQLYYLKQQQQIMERVASIELLAHEPDFTNSHLRVAEYWNPSEPPDLATAVPRFELKLINSGGLAIGTTVEICGMLAYRSGAGSPRSAGYTGPKPVVSPFGPFDDPYIELYHLAVGYVPGDQKRVFDSQSRMFISSPNPSIVIEYRNGHDQLRRKGFRVRWKGGRNMQYAFGGLLEADLVRVPDADIEGKTIGQIFEYAHLPTQAAGPPS